MSSPDEFYSLDKYADLESPAKPSTIDWLRERLENCERLAKECPENDKAGWLQDAEYFRDAIRLIWRSERSGAASPPVAGTTQKED